MKFCKDCKHINFLPNQPDSNKWFYAVCSAPDILDQRINLVSGERIFHPPYCSQQRGDSGALRNSMDDERQLCGREAKYFEPINNLECEK